MNPKRIIGKIIESKENEPVYSCLHDYKNTRRAAEGDKKEENRKRQKSLQINLLHEVIPKCDPAESGLERSGWFLVRAKSYATRQKWMCLFKFKNNK